MDSLPVVIHSPAEDRVLYAFGEEVHLYMNGSETGGRFAQWLVVSQPGGGPPPHYHTNDDEWFCVLEGQVSFFRDGEWSEPFGPGTRAWCPRHSVHTYKNVGTTDSRILQMTEPAGFDQFFTRSAAEFARAGAPDMSRVTEIAAEHGIFFVTPQQIALRAALPAPKVLIHPPAENRVHRAFGDEVHLYLSGKETGHLFSQALVITQPGGGPPPHYHTQEDEWFHVLHGSVSFFYQGNWTEVRAGGRVWCPKGSVHTFQNTGDNPSQMLVTTSPAGFDRFFALCAAEFDNPEGPNMPRIMEIAAEHGIFFVEP